MQKQIFLILFTFILTVSAIGQDQTSTNLDSLAILTPADTTIAFADSSKPVIKKAQKVVLDSARYGLSGLADSNAVYIYKHKDIIHLNYNGLADAFRNRSTFQIFDFYEMGEPRFISTLNLLPHQTTLNYEGVVLNDPLSGLYSTRFISLDAVENIEATSFQSDLSDNGLGLHSGINVKGRFLNPKEPYSRLMFREGDNGYMDLDIQFARKINDRFGVQLSGINRSNAYNRHSGVIYQGAINFQLTPRLFSRTIYRLDDEGLILTDFINSYNYKYKEQRQELIEDLTYWCNDSKTERWHIKTGFSGSLRSRYANVSTDSFKVKYRYDRYFFSGDRNLKFKTMEWLAGFSFFQNQTWGNAFSKDFIDSGFQTYLRVNYQPIKQITLQPAVHWNSYYGDNSYFTSSFLGAFDFSNSLQFQAQVSQNRRKPTRIEQSFDYTSLSSHFTGNSDLSDEKMQSLVLKSIFKPSKKYRINFESGYRQIKDEIHFNSSVFYNGDSRSFSYFALDGSADFGLLNFSGGGQYTQAGTYVSPKTSGWLRLGYQDYWLNKALLIDGHITLNVIGEHNAIYYNKFLERFYWTDGTDGGYYTLSFKLVATVKDAQFYMAMDNFTSNRYAFIHDHEEYYRKVRFGLNWALWN